MIEDPDPSDGKLATLQESDTAVEIDVSLQSPVWRALDFDAETLCKQAVHGTLSAVGSGNDVVEVSIVLGDDELLQRLNRENRDADRPTNVLAFPCDPPGGSLPEGAPRLLGDVVLSRETIAEEARLQYKPFENHLRHLVVHGILHLLGYGHDTETEAQTMESLEVVILARMKIPDPYMSSNLPVSEPA